MAGFDWDYGVPGTERRVPLTVTATPKNYRDGLSAVFTLTPESGVPQTARRDAAGGIAMRPVRSRPVPLEMEYQDFAVFRQLHAGLGKPKRRNCSGNTILSRATRRHGFGDAHGI